MAVDIGARIKVDGEAAYNQQISQIIKLQKELKADMQATAAAFDKDASNKDKSAAKTKQLERQMTTANEKLRLQREELAKLEAAGQGASAKADSLRVSIARTEAEVAKLNREMRENSGMAAFGRDLQSAGESMQKIGGKMSAFGTTMTRTITAPLAAAGAAAVKLATDFETAMAKLNSIADTSEKSLDDLKKEVMDLSNATGIAATDIAEQTYQAISAGQSTANSVRFVESTTKLARAGFAETGNALDVLTTITNAYGKAADDVTTISDKLIMTQNLGKTTVGQLSENMGQAIPTAAAYSVNLDNITSAYVTLTKQGINTANATTQINGLLNQLGKSGTKASDVLMDKTGKSFKELMEGGASLADVLMIVRDAAEEDGLALNDMFGNVRAGRAAMAIMNDEGVTFAKSLKSMASAAGTTEVAFRKVTDTTAYKFEVALNKVKNSGIEAGQQLLIVLAPAIEKIADFITRATENFSQMSRQEQQAVIKTALFAASIGPAVTALGKLTSGLGSAVQGAGKLIEKWGMMGQIPTSGIVGIAGAFVGVSAALATWSYESEKAAVASQAVMRESQKTAEAAQDVSKEVTATADAYRQSSAEIDDNAKKANKLVGRLEELGKKSKLTAAEEREMAAAVASLNEFYPGLNLTINENTGRLSQNTKELRDNIKNLNEQAKAVAAQERLVEVNKQILDVQAQRERATQQLAEAQKALTAASDEYNKSQELGTTNGSVQYQEAARQVKQLKDSITELDEQEKMLNTDIDQANKYLDAHGGALDEASTAAASAEGSVDGVTDALEEEAAAAEESAQKIMEAARLQVGAFDMVEQAQTKSLDEIIAGLKSQITAEQNYRKNLDTLQQYIANDARGNWSEISAIFASGGIEMAGELQGIVDAIERGDTDALNELARLTVGIKDETTRAGNALVGLATTYTRETAKIPAGISKNIPAAKIAGRNLGAAGADAVIQAIRARRHESEEAGRYITEGLAKGINSKADLVNAAASNVASIAIRQMRNVPQVSSPSKVTTKIGEFIAQGLAIGMRNETTMVRQEAAALAEAALPRVASATYEIGGAGEGAQAVAESIKDIALAPEAIYEAMSAALEDADLKIVIGNREFGRVLREQGAL